MTKPPTAEEVLAKYREFREWMLAGNSNTANAIELNEAFVEAFDQWQAAQGPVTREWFIERFGGPSWNCVDCELTATSTRILLAMRTSGDQWASIPLRDPTREDIERLVRMLGGSAD